MSNLKNSTAIKNTAAIKDAFRDLAKAFREHKDRMRVLAKPLITAKVVESDMKPGGLYYDDLLDGVARAYLTEEQYVIWADTSLSVQVKGEKTERGKLQPKVTSNLSKVRNAVLEAMDVTKYTSKAGQPRTATQIFFDDMDKYVEKFAKDDASDKFEFDTREARHAIIAMVRNLK